MKNNQKDLVKVSSEFLAKHIKSVEHFLEILRKQGKLKRRLLPSSEVCVDSGLRIQVLSGKKEINIPKKLFGPRNPSENQGHLRQGDMG